MTPRRNWDTECFFIAPIGKDGSPERRRSDGLLALLREVLDKDPTLTVVRADEISESGIITTQICEHLVNACLAVADLAGLNPNVLYELGVRHAFHKPVVQLSEPDQALPFDLEQVRTLQIDTTDLSACLHKKAFILQMVQHALKEGSTSPLTAYANLEQLRSGGAEARGIADLTEEVSRLSGDLRQVRKQLDDLQATTGHVPFFYAPPHTLMPSSTGYGAAIPQPLTTETPIPISGSVTGQGLESLFRAPPSSHGLRGYGLGSDDQDRPKRRPKKP